MGNSNFRRLTSRASRRHGVFSRADARELEIPDSTLSDGAARGWYSLVAPQVYVMAGSPSTLQQRLSIVLASMPALAALSHQTAAEMWGLTRRGVRRVEIQTTRWDRVPRADVTVHESLDLVASDVVLIDGLPVTTAVRTVVDLGASNRWVVEKALEQGIRQGLFALSDIEEFVARVARKGRRGVGVIRPLIAERKKWDTATESALEDLFCKVVDQAGLAEPKSQYVVRNASDGFVCRADFAYPERRLLIELDSEAHHMDRDTFRRDRSKQNSVHILGWTVLRYTWWDLTHEPYRVVAELRAALAR